MTVSDGAYALWYAYRTASAKAEHFYEHPTDCQTSWPIHYYTWVVVTNGEPIVFDTGFRPEEAARRGSRHYLASPIELLADLDVAPDDVRTVVLSHLHYDHTGYLAAYPNARLVVQHAELNFWQGPYAQRSAYAHLRHDDDLAQLQRLVEDGRVDVLDGDAQVAPGVTVHCVGGHTAGTQVIRAVTPDGVVVLASDASHFYANLEEDAPYGVVHDLAKMYAAFDKLYELAGADGVVVPGHDPRVIDRHEPVAGSDNRIIRLRPQGDGKVENTER